ncbi:KTSC domain-containing protein [Microbacterium sp. NPDC057659]|uniref:KTSC domain-containing protein n=1 Tax=Microbacterium sp. NPDC057659 TaxID=3346198 RepID=UPI0036715C19
MRRQPVRSSAIASVGYDPGTAVLEVEFRSSDRYRYYAVPPSVHRAFVEAPSVGRYFQEHIRDRYPVEQL